MVKLGRPDSVFISDSCDVLPDVRGGVGAVFAVFFEHPGQQVDDFFRCFDEVRNSWGRLGQVFDGGQLRRFGDKGRAAGVEFEPDGGQGVEVKPVVEFFEFKFFRTDVGQGPSNHSVGGEGAVGLGQAHKPEVEEFDAQGAVFDGQFEVGGFEVAVDDALAVRVVEAGEGLVDDFHGQGERQAAVRKQPGEVVAVNEFHDDEEAVFHVTTKVEDAGDVG